MPLASDDTGAHGCAMDNYPLPVGPAACASVATDMGLANGFPRSVAVTLPMAEKDDSPVDGGMQCHGIMMARYFPQDRVISAINPAAMRYAGPRKAIFHALLRKHYGYTPLIVGGAQAGVGDNCGTFNAQHIFNRSVPGELRITPKFEHAFYCTRMGTMALSKTSPSSKDEQLRLSGTGVRRVAAGVFPPEAAVELSRAMQGQS